MVPRSSRGLRSRDGENGRLRVPREHAAQLSHRHGKWFNAEQLRLRKSLPDEECELPAVSSDIDYGCIVVSECHVFVLGCRRDTETKGGTVTALSEQPCQLSGTTKQSLPRDADIHGRIPASVPDAHPRTKEPVLSLPRPDKYVGPQAQGQTIALDALDLIPHGRLGRCRASMRHGTCLACVPATA